jgi:pyruvate,water dikinase
MADVALPRKRGISLLRVLEVMLMATTSLSLLTPASPAADIERYAGNKGKSLFSLGRAGLRVPPWAIVGANVFAAFRRDSGLNARIVQLLQSFTPDHSGRISQEIVDAIITAGMSSALREHISQALIHLGDGPIAVRSSGLEEDGTQFSFAGQFDTYLGVQGVSATLEHVRKCWASAYSERALRYRHQHRLNLDCSGMAVILQHLIAAEKSGVVFTVNPANGDRDQAVISSVYGLGEGLVSGAVDADTMVVNRITGAVIDTVIGEKRERYERHGIVGVPLEFQGKLSLEPEELAGIVAAAGKIESAYGKPQDIEWCIADRELWILQARPVTTPVASGQFQLWDNSNIVENYPGITSQLTFTFAQRVYSQVFREFSRLLGVPRKQLRQMDGFFDSVLGYLNGRVYYNLLHWYKLSGLAPFQTAGRKMMEVQMGVGEALDLSSFAARIEPFTTSSFLERTYIRCITGAKFAWYFITLKRQVAEFRRFFYGVYEKFDRLDYKAMPADEVYGHYVGFERELLSRWGVMIALESAIGLSYGLLRALVRRWLPEAPAWFEVAVIGGMDDVESVAPVRALADIAHAVRARPALEQIIRETPSEEAYSALRRAHQPDVLQKVERYIREFGYRSKNELKLEEPDLHDDPSVLFDMLKAALTTSGETMHREQASADACEPLVGQLNPLQRWLFAIARKRARTAIQARETVRFCRSRAFGVVRRMFRAIGEGLARDGVLENPRDVMHLRLDELRGCFDGTTSHRELRPLIDQRRADHAAYGDMPDLPPRFATRGSVAAWLSDPANVARLHTKASSSSDGELSGTPCSPGVAEGVAKVVREANEFDGGILVAYRTDPGWVPVFGSAQALLVERGSPLTHAAIVAREIGIPTIVQIPGLTSQVKTGMRLKVDGHSGRISFLPAAA